MRYDTAWAIWFRGGLHPSGSWHCWGRTASYTRTDAIDVAVHRELGGMRTRNDWRNARRRGLVAARRTTLSARLPA